MTMPSTGVLNMGGTSSPVSVNFELGKASPYQQTVSMNDAAVRTLAGVSSTSGTSWSMNSLYGKSNRTVAFNNANTFDGLVTGGTTSLTLTFTSAGTITTSAISDGVAYFTAPTSFISPTGDTTGMSVRCHFTSITRSGAGAGVSVFGTAVGAVSSYDSGYVNFAGANKVITGSSSNPLNTFYGTGTIYITDGTTTISRAIVFDVNS